jgi:hypothetical protein
MNYRIAKLATALLASALIAGCAGTYQTNATDTQLSAYAGQAVYPTTVSSTQSLHVFCTVGNDGTITLYNAGDEIYSNFELWINRLYTLHIDKLDARTTLAVDPATIYNKTGVNLKGVPANSFNLIQIYSQGKLQDVQGPILPH